MDEPRRCSMSSYMQRPWTCGSGDCLGRREDCAAKARNEREQSWLERQAHNPQQVWENAWLEAYDMPVVLDIDAARAAFDKADRAAHYLRYARR